MVLSPSSALDALGDKSVDLFLSELIAKLRSVADSRFSSGPGSGLRVPQMKKLKCTQAIV